MPTTSILIPAALLAIAFASGCAQSDAARTETSSTSVDHHAVHLPAPTQTSAAHLPGLHNVVAYDDGVYSGALPEGDEGFATLHALGIKTVVSVDGARPDVDAAERHGLRYVHLPISYDGIAPERGQEIAQALASLPGPIYMHCHHGKHRSASAVAVACVGAGRLSPEQAMERMKVSGTADNYQGLWAAVRSTTPMSPQQLQRDPQSFPQVAKVSGMVEVMSAVDMVFENLKSLDKNGWAVPEDHPDLVPTKESQRLAELFVTMKKDPESVAYPADYQTILDRSIADAKAFDAALRANDAAEASARYAALGKSCKECHRTYRDQ